MSWRKAWYRGSGPSCKGQAAVAQSGEGLQSQTDTQLVAQLHRVIANLVRGEVKKDQMFGNGLQSLDLFGREVADGHDAVHRLAFRQEKTALPVLQGDTGIFPLLTALAHVVAQVEEVRVVQLAGAGEHFGQSHAHQRLGSPATSALRGGVIQASGLFQNAAAGLLANREGGVRIEDAGDGRRRAAGTVS